MDIHVEPLDGVIGELDNLLHEYWRDTEAGKDMPALAMDWPAYCQLERVGALVLLVARKEHHVAGFVQYVVVKHTKHRGIRMAQCDTLAVRVKERGHGIGEKLMRAGEHELRKRGVQQVVHGFRLVYNKQPLFPKLGYKPIETLYMKEL